MSKRICIQGILWIAILSMSGMGLVTAQAQRAFRHLNIVHGLSSNNVKAFLQDGEGFLWIGTENGLNRYDGYHLKAYWADRDSVGALPFGDVSQLQEDGGGNLWIGNDPYCLYLRKTDSFEADVTGVLQRMGADISHSKLKLHVDKKKRLWVVQDSAVICIDHRTKQTKRYRMAKAISLEQCLGLSDDGKHLFILQDNVLWKSNPELGQCECIGDELLPSHPATGKNEEIYIDNRGGMWLFSYSDDCLFYRKNARSGWRLVQLTSGKEARSNATRSITDDGNGHVWVATDHQGVFVYDVTNDRWENLTNSPLSSTSIASNRINTVYTDSQGVIWIGHAKKGISYSHESFYEFIDTRYQECSDIAALLEDRAGNIWIGTDGNGLYVKERERNMSLRKLPVPDVAIITLAEDAKGRIWAGSYQDGLFCIEDSHVTHLTTTNSTLPFDHIWKLVTDRFGHLWIGCVLHGLVCIDPESGSVHKLALPDGYNIQVTDMSYDGGDKLYIGTTYGICIADIVTQRTEMHHGNRAGSQQLASMFVSHILKDRQNLLWIGDRQGVTVWDLQRDSLYRLNRKYEAEHHLVKSLVEDNHGHVWMSSSNGLAVCDPNRSEQGGMDFFLQHFTARDGLGDNCFNGYAVCRLANGDLLFGGTGGYTRVNPNKLKEDVPSQNQIRFTSACVDRRSLTREEMKGITMNHNDYQIAIEWFTGNLLNAGQTRFAYRMVGLDSRWQTTGENRVTFTALPAGKYRLQVRVADETAPNPIATLPVTVLPPPYLSGIAIALYVIVSGMALAVLLYFFQRQHQAKLARQRTRAEQEQRLLLNEMKLKFFTNISHDLRTPLTLIISPLQLLLDEVEPGSVHRKLEVIHVHALQLLGQINSLLDFRKLDVGAETLHRTQGDMVSFVREVCGTFQEYASEHGFLFNFMCEKEYIHTSFDPEKIRKVINNLLSNAFKYTPDKGEINVHLYQEDDHVCIGIADNGAGITDRDKKHIFERFYQVPQTQEKTGSGIGLHIAYEYVQMHQGSITVTDNYPRGSIFTVKLPSAVSPDDRAVGIPPAPISVTSTESRYTLLLVDDNRDFCAVMGEYLADEYSIRTANNGREALEVLEKDNINLVISDVMMPVMDGTELCRQIKTNVRWSHIPVILLTARMAEECRTEGLRLGADDYIVKPFDFNLLKLRIRKFMEWTEKSHRTFHQQVEVEPSDITITPLDEQFIAKAIDIVERRMGETEFSVEMLGSELGLSRGHLYKKLMSITGKGPADFIRIIRLKRSRQLLEKSQKQIAEIAYEVGFSSPKRFSINFKSEFGMSPSDYLRNIKSEAKDIDDPFLKHDKP